MTLAIFRTGGLAAIAAVTLTFSLSTAFAQTPEKPGKSAETPQNNWSVNCGAGETADSPLVCQMVQNVVVVESNQRLLTVVIRPQKEAANYMLTLALPHGVDFLKGVEVVIDDKKAFTVPVQTSNAQGAFSNLPISDALLADLKSGSSMKFSFQSMSGQTFAVPISLIGFSTAYQKLSAG